MSDGMFLKVAGIAGTLIPIGGALIGLGIYVGNLTNQIEASKAEVQSLKGQVTQLQEILQKSQGGAMGARGPKGDKGDQGDAGPKGDRGAPGAPGGSESADLSPILNRVAALERAVNANKQTSSDITPSSAGASPVACIPMPAKLTSGAFILQDGNRLCGSSGEFIAKLEVRSDSSIRFVNGGSYFGCNVSNRCDFFQKMAGTFILDDIKRSAEGNWVTQFSIYPR